MATPTKEVIQRLVGLGYPESVARRIAGGELDMSPQARLARQQSMFPDIMYHGGSDDILNINTNQVSRGKTANTGFFAASRPEMASSYAPSQGAVYPLAVNTSGFDVVDAGSSRWNDITSPDYYFGGQTPATLEAVKERVPGMFTGDRDLSENYFNLAGAVRNTFDTDDLARFARRTGSPGLLVRNVSDFGPNASSLRASAEGVRPDISDEAMKSYLDNLTGDVAVSVDPNRVRSLLSAAFDPEYTGSNIMGSRLAPTAAAGLLGAGAMMAPENAEASPYGTREDLIAGIEEKLRPLPEPEPTIAPIENDRIGQIVNTVGDLFGGGYHDYRAAENLMNVADLMPWFGSGISLQQGADAYRQGKVGEGRLLTGLGLLEFIPIAGKIASNAVKASRAGRAANRSLDDFASRMSDAEIATRAPQTQEQLMRALGWQ